MGYISRWYMCGRKRDGEGLVVEDYGVEVRWGGVVEFVEAECGGGSVFFRVYV